MVNTTVCVFESTRVQLSSLVMCQRDLSASLWHTDAVRRGGGAEKIGPCPGFPCIVPCNSQSLGHHSAHESR